MQDIRLEALVEHLIHPKLLERRVAVHLVGVGGNGAQMAACLARLDIAMRALGHPLGLHVKASTRIASARPMWGGNSTAPPTSASTRPW